jgi:hypothetical protein
MTDLPTPRDDAEAERMRQVLVWAWRHRTDGSSIGVFGDSTLAGFTATALRQIPNPGISSMPELAMPELATPWAVCHRSLHALVVHRWFHTEEDARQLANGGEHFLVCRLAVVEVVPLDRPAPKAPPSVTVGGMRWEKSRSPVGGTGQDQWWRPGYDTSYVVATGDHALALDALHALLREVSK